jgi:hypothetical protein
VNKVYVLESPTSVGFSNTEFHCIVHSRGALEGRLYDVIGPAETSLGIYISDSHIIYQLGHLEATYDQRTQNS